MNLKARLKDRDWRHRILESYGIHQGIWFEECGLWKFENLREKYSNSFKGKTCHTRKKLLVVGGWQGSGGWGRRAPESEICLAVEPKKRRRWSTLPHGWWRLSAPSLSPFLWPSSAFCTFSARQAQVFLYFSFSGMVCNVWIFYLQYLKKKNQNPLFQALQKVKEGGYMISFSLCFWFLRWRCERFDGGVGAELMLLGFISLLLTVFQNLITKFCVPKHVVSHLLPCKLPEEKHATQSLSHWALGRHLLSSAPSSCSNEVANSPYFLLFLLFVIHYSSSSDMDSGKKFNWWKGVGNGMALWVFKSSSKSQPDTFPIPFHCKICRSWDMGFGSFKGMVYFPPKPHCSKQAKEFIHDPKGF